MSPSPLERYPCLHYTLYSSRHDTQYSFDIITLNMRTRYVGVYATIPVGGAASGEDIDMAVWEPTSLQAQPWTSVYVGSQLHLVKGVFHEAGYEVLCWDKRTMWEEKVGGGEMTERMKVRE